MPRRSSIDPSAASRREIGESFNPKEEMDFRSLQLEECERAHFYECGRDFTDFRERAVRLLDKDIAGQSVRCILWNWLAASPKVWDEIEALGLVKGEGEMYFLTQYAAFFPTPWVKVSPEERRPALDPGPAEPSVRLYLVREGLGDYQEPPDQAWNPSRIQYLASIDENVNINDNVRAFRQAISAEREKRGLSLRGVSRDMGPTKLKWMAARRLAEAGLKHSRLHAFLVEYEKQNPMQNNLDILPNYRSAGAWDGAIKQGQRELENFKRFLARRRSTMREFAMALTHGHRGQ